MAAISLKFDATVEAIETAVTKTYEKSRQDAVVRASSIGKCERYLWYRFRWADYPQTFEPRILRLFETGHLEEARMIAWLRRAGMSVEALDPTTDDQWEVVYLDGHFKGHLDGIVTGVPDAPKTAHLLECKTHNAKSFAQLVRHGVQASKPEHYGQMQIYMHLKSLTRALYLAKNKDTDELYSERIPYDATEALRLISKAERVVDAVAPPPRLSDNPDWFECRFCPSKGLCHDKEPALRNCRTCLHSTARPEGKWVCDRYEGKRTRIAASLMREGCPQHRYLPGLVDGLQVDVDPDWVITYELAPGLIWKDEGQRDE